MKRNIKHYIISFLCIFAFWLGGVPFIFSKTVPIICENLSYNSRYDISIKNPKLRLNIIPTASIETDNITVREKETDNNLTIEHFKLNIRILPLLSGKMHLNKIVISNININTKLCDNVELDKNFINNIKKTNVQCDNFEIKNLKLLINQKDINKNSIYTAENILYKNTRRYLDINIKSNIKINNMNSEAAIKIYLPKNNDINKSNFDIHVSNLNITPIADCFKNYLPKDLVKANGIINIDADKSYLKASLKEIKFIKNDKAKSIEFPEELNIESVLHMTSDNISIENAQIKSNDINLAISGTISEYLKKRYPKTNLDIRINNSSVYSFIKLLPPFKTEDIDMYKLKKYKFYGNLLGNLNIKSNSAEPSINGSVFINNGVLIKPIPNANGAIIKLDFKGKYLNFDVTVPAGYSESVKVNGGVELYNVKYSDMHVWSTKNVNLATAEEKVVPIHEILNFVIGPVPIMDVKGFGNIDITIKGNRKNPHVWGELNLRDVKTYFYEIPDLLLTNANAKLVFNDENATFNLLKGNINNENVNIDGICNLAGKFDFDVSAAKQPLMLLYKSVKTSSMIDDIKSMIPDIDIIQGTANLRMKVYGNIKDIDYIKFNDNFFIKGILELKDDIIKYQGIKVKNINGEIDFDNNNANIKISSNIGNAPLQVNTMIKNGNADADIKMSKLNLKDILPDKNNFTDNITNIFLEFNAKYKGKIDSIEFDKLDFNARVLGVAPNNKLTLSNGFIILKNSKLQIKNLYGTFLDTKSSFNINLQTDNMFNNPMTNGIVELKDFELQLINSIGEYKIIPETIRKKINSLHFTKGKINTKARIVNNNVNASTDIGGVELNYIPYNLPIKIINGSIYLRKNYLGLNKINIMADGMPLLFDGGINNIFTDQDINLYINSKPKQEFVDKYINNTQIYPLKFKGDIVYWIKIKGTPQNYFIESEANLTKDSSIYYLGATIGDLENTIILNLNMNILNNYLKIKEFSYDKLIDSQGKRKTRLNLLKASGSIELLENDCIFHDLKVKTSHPTDARIFNILFRKPNIKKGQFTSDLKFNGRLSNPHLTGIFHIVETNIPFLDTTMKNLLFVFKEKTIDLSSSGEVFGNEIKFKGTLKNKLTTPYYIENAELYTKSLDLNYITNRIKMAHVSETNAFDPFLNFNMKNTVIKNMKIKANEIKLRNILAENVSAALSVSDKNIFNIDNFKFNIANGTLSGKLLYNMLNDNMAITLKANNIDANDMAVALFNLNNQIYGDLTGNLKLSCNGSEFNKCMETLNGSLMFDVTNGRMPKLGSLEYLLKAGNLVKGGFTGLSINSIIDILTPLKTGNFSEIYGNMKIKDGYSDNIEISTRGKDLNLFLTGNYNFSNANAEMEVLGILSKKISTMFGPIGNVSLNTLFNVVPGIDLTKDSKLLDKINKIPGIELNDKEFRKFIAEIKGDINGDNYVKSFKWIN